MSQGGLVAVTWIHNLYANNKIENVYYKEDIHHINIHLLTINLKKTHVYQANIN